MTQIAVASAQPVVVSSVLGSRPVQLPIGGVIRPGIKILTRDAEKNAKAKALYESGQKAGKAFDVIEKEIKEAVPDLANPLRPVNVPYFSVRGGDFGMPELAKQILDKYGEVRADGVKRLYRFPVIFAVDNWLQTMPHSLQCYASGKLKYWSEYADDGVTRRCMSYAPVPKGSKGKAIRVFGGRKPIERPDAEGRCDPEQCPEYQNRQCNLTGKLLFLIPGIPSISLIALPTRSFYSMDDIRRKLEHVARMRGGRISGYLNGTQTFWLTKVLKDVSRIDDEGNPVKGAQWLIQLEADVDIGGLLLEHQTEEGASAGAEAAVVLEGEAVTVQSAGQADQACSESEHKTDALTNDQIRDRVRDLRAEIFRGRLPAMGVDPQEYSDFGARQFSEGWSTKLEGLVQASAHIKAIEPLRLRLRDLLNAMDISAQLFQEYAVLRFRRRDWSLNEEALKKAIGELESHVDKPDTLRALIDEETKVI